MSDPILPFAVWEQHTLQNSIPANDNSLRNQILNGLVISESTDAQPGSPADGDIYIMTSSASGTQWATFDEFDLAIFMDGTWYAYAPVAGIVVNVAGTLKRWNGSAYVDVGTGGGSDRSTTTALTSGSTVTIDLSLGDYFTLTLAHNATIAFSNPPGSGHGFSVRLKVTQDGTGSRTLTQPAAVKLIPGSDATIQSAASSVSLIHYTSDDNGTSIDATIKARGT